MNRGEHLTDQLASYLPETAGNYISNIVVGINIQIRVSPPRKTKLGDYRPPFNGQNHRISINNNLNRYEFLLVLLHEIAHALVWTEHKRDVQPHGREWKTQFRNLLWWMYDKNVFPPNIAKAIKNDYFKKPSFTGGFSVQLREELLKYSSQKNVLRVKDLPENVIFQLKTGKQFIKIEKLRSRYKCKCIQNNRLYAIHQFAEVINYKDLN